MSASAVAEPAAGEIGRRLGSIALGAVLAVAVVLMLGPILVVVLISFSAGETFVFPPPGFSLRWFELFVRTPNLTSALWLSLGIAAAAGTIATILALMAAAALVRLPAPRLSAILQSAFVAPLVFPTIVLGLSLLLFYRVVGINLTLGLVLAHVTVALPYAFRSILSELTAFDPALSEAAASLGADAWRSLWYVTLPIVWPGLLSGWVFAFVVSIGELNTSLFLTGPGFTTLPIEVFGYLQFEGAQLVIAAASTIQIAIVIMLFAAIETARRVGASYRA